MKRIVHILNAVHMPEAHPLSVAQRLTFESMRIAREGATGCDVSFVSTHYAEDDDALPPFVEHAPRLTRSLLDFGTFEPPRKLPLLADILAPLKTASADYVVFTNVDIGLQPYFYDFVSRAVDAGDTCFTVNRRDIALTPDRVQDLPAIWSQVGQAHPGHDCFVFPRALADSLDLDDVVVGMPWVGTVLLANLMCLLPATHVREDLHATFHLGSDKAWKADAMVAHRIHNARAALRVFDRLEAKHGSFAEASALKGWHAVARKQVQKAGA